MKKLIITSMILTLAACSPPLVEGASTVHFSIGKGITGKSTGISEEDEKEISHWAVMLFNARESSEKFCESVSGGADISFTIRSGARYRAYAIANYPRYGEYAFDPDRITDEETLKRSVISLADYSPSSLPMFGETEITALGGEVSSTVSLTRLVSKVVVKKITADIREERFRALPFHLKALYLTNVWCRNSLAEDLPAEDAPELWYNAMGWHGSGSNGALDALVADRNINAPIAQGGSYSTLHCFYTMPDAVTKDHDKREAAWSSRCTRLVIEAAVGTKTYYYPVTLPDMKRGAAYIIEEVTIRNVGSLSPEEEIPGAVDVNITVSVPGAWDKTYTISENS